MTLKFTPKSAGPLARLIATQPKAPNPTGEDRVIPPESPEHKPVIKSIVEQTDAKLNAADAVFDAISAMPDATIQEENLTGDSKLSRLVDDDFPFDESQLEAVYGIVQEQYACLTGAAGTGKTTVTKKIVDMLQSGVKHISLTNYWKGVDKEQIEDDGDDYESTDNPIPSICLCAFTGRAAQMIKKNFPVDWHSNIMTIHRMLGFRPVFFEEFDPASGEMRNTMRFEPTYNRDNKLPWDIIVVDEAGMQSLDLWHMMWDACRPTTRIILIGDINQLPPTHGKSIFGFAMSEWPSWELTHVHRQQGVNNSIVDNAHRILKGLKPISDSPKQLAILNSATAKETLTYMLKDKDWRFLTVTIDEGSTKAGAFIRECLRLLKGANFYDPNRDAVITAINGYDTGQTGYGLGQDTMNRELSMLMNPDNPRYIIDGGRERRNFAVGDRVMATKNDWEAGITNGMDGIITAITEHEGYTGDRRAFGRSDLVDEYMAEHDEDDSHDMSLEDFNLESYEVGKKEKEGQGRGPASHILTIQFGEGASMIEMTFATQAEVASIQLSYVKTCHKMQGGEAPLVFVILHQTFKRINREWLYTAVTRASGRCVVLFTRDGMGRALVNQSIKGRNLAEKVVSFQKLQEIGIAGASVTVRMPRKSHLVKHESQPQDHDHETIEADLPKTEVHVKQTIHIDKVVVRNQTIVINKESTNEPSKESNTVDGGEIQAERQDAGSQQSRIGSSGILPPPQRQFTPAKRAATLGAIQTMLAIADARAVRLLPAPKPEVVAEPKPAVKPKVNFAALIAGVKK